MNTEKYFKELEKEVHKNYKFANVARGVGLDPSSVVEIPLAMSMSEKVVGLVSTVYPQIEGTNISKRIIELEKEYGKLDPTVAFKIAEEVAGQKFCGFSSLLQSIEAGIRVGFAYLTLSVVSSPIEGFVGLKIGKTHDNKEYFKAYFSGPIRSAGTTAGCLALMLIDYLREIFGFAKYDPTEEEIQRMVIENQDYHDRITNLQYLPTAKESVFLASHLPIQVTGDASSQVEVSNYKNLERIETNKIRGGMCLILSEALAQKAPKGLRILNHVKENGIIYSGFDWLKDYVELHEKETMLSDNKDKDTTPTYIRDLVAGRPVFGHPSRSGGFRFRYGRGRTSGFSAASIHPATMAITDNFIAIGTQLRIEKPTKGCIVTSCDSIDGPIVKLLNGNVKKIKTAEEAKKIYQEIEEIIYLGDILFPFSDVVNRNSVLVKPGYVEEWWNLELKEKNKKLAEKNNFYNVSFDDAVKLSEEYKIPMHPNYIFFWTEISKEQFQNLIEWIKFSKIHEKLILPFGNEDKIKFSQGKRALELLGIEHAVTTENVVVDKTKSQALFLNLGLDYKIFNKDEDLLVKDICNLDNFGNGEKVLDIVNSSAAFVIKDKAGDFIGSRMGRPEKAKLRKLPGSPNSLFPIGTGGGRLTTFQAACEADFIKEDLPHYFCKECQKETIYIKCENCENKTEKLFYCYECNQKYNKSVCPLHKIELNFHSKQVVDINHFYNSALKRLGVAKEDIGFPIKGVKRLSSGEKTPENIAKGILRAKYNLQVNRDGTIRFDATEIPLICFKPKEIGVSVKKLIELGYDKDIDGGTLENEEQILELMPHDILLPSCAASSDEKADDVFIRICNFVDELLEKFYGLKKFYNIKTREGLVGQLGVCIAPHNCAGVVCRIIGFSNTLGLLASPYMHAAVRRDCDGDEASIMLLGDVLLNFSKKYLPSHRGGTQDAPLVLNAKIDAGEVDEQILDLELTNGYPLELYEKAEKRLHSVRVEGIENIKQALKKNKDVFHGIGFTHDTSNFNIGVNVSSYKMLATMQDKVKHQMKLVEKLRAVDAPDVAKLIIEKHFIKDMRGNLRKFSQQSFRCVVCNEIFRRPPIKGECSKCGGKLIFTVNEGGIKKYLEPALALAKKYNLSRYIQENLELVKRYINSIFGEDETQIKLERWFG